MNEWTKFVTQYYHDQKRTNKAYQFKDAMKDAKKVYKRGTKKSTGGAMLPLSPEEVATEGVAAAPADMPVPAGASDLTGSTGKTLGGEKKKRVVSKGGSRKTRRAKK
jgi:hypothetical protein